MHQFGPSHWDYWRARAKSSHCILCGAQCPIWLWFQAEQNWLCLCPSLKFSAKPGTENNRWSSVYRTTEAKRRKQSSRKIKQWENPQHRMSPLVILNQTRHFQQHLAGVITTAMFLSMNLFVFPDVLCKNSSGFRLLCQKTISCIGLLLADWISMRSLPMSNATLTWWDLLAAALDLGDRTWLQNRTPMHRLKKREKTWNKWNGEHAEINWVYWKKTFLCNFYFSSSWIWSQAYFTPL